MVRLLLTMQEEYQIANRLVHEDGMRRRRREKTEDAETVSAQDREVRHSRKCSAKSDVYCIQRRRGEEGREMDQERRTSVETDIEQNNGRRESVDKASRNARRA